MKRKRTRAAAGTIQLSRQRNRRLTARRRTKVPGPNGMIRLGFAGRVNCIVGIAFQLSSRRPSHKP